jgi:hypothetical protein
MLLPISGKGPAKAKDAKKADKQARAAGRPVDAMRDVDILVKVIQQTWPSMSSREISVIPLISSDLRRDGQKRRS